MVPAYRSHACQSLIIYALKNAGARMLAINNISQSIYPETNHDEDISAIEGDRSYSVWLKAPELISTYLDSKTGRFLNLQVLILLWDRILPLVNLTKKIAVLNKIGNQFNTTKVRTKTNQD